MSDDLAFYLFISALSIIFILNAILLAFVFGWWRP